MSLWKGNTRDTGADGTVLFSIFFVMVIQGPTPVIELSAHTGAQIKLEKSEQGQKIVAMSTSWFVIL